MNVPGTSNVLYSDETYNNHNGLTVSYKTAANKGAKGYWITELYVDGVKVFDTSMCEYRTFSSLPECTRKSCNQIREKPSSGLFSYASQQSVMLDGVWPFTTKNNIEIEVHCLSKRRINTGIKNYQNTRLDVYVNKESAFQKSTLQDTEANAFMMNELAIGSSGKCVEPFASSTSAIQSLGNKKINGWAKSNKIDPGSCTCGQEGSDVI